MRAARARRAQLTHAETKLQNLSRLLDHGFSVQTHIAECKQALAALYETRSKGLIFRSRVRFVEENETCSRFFFRKLKAGGQLIEGLLDSEGTEQTTNEGMRECVRDFYKDLYTERDSSTEAVDFFLEQLELRLSEEDQADLEGELCLDDLDRAMQSP